MDASDFGVPQRRRRAIFIAYLKGEAAPSYPVPSVTDESRVNVQQAIGDLIRDAKVSKQDNPRTTAYQNDSIYGRTPNINGIPISYQGDFMNNEISRHQKIIVERFSLFKEGEDGSALRKRICSEGIDLTSKKHLLQECSEKLGLSVKEIIAKFLSGDISDEMLDALLTRKTIRTKLYRSKPSLTVVTLPDDYISPFENRTLSVREMARLQSFDDSFEFLSKRTTGGARRKVEVPQYTQVGNAVPPLLAKAVAAEIMKAIKKGAN